MHRSCNTNHADNIIIDIFLHTQSKQSKAYGSHAKHSYCHPVNQHWVPLRHLSLVQTNPVGAGLKFHNDPNTTKRDKDSWAFAFSHTHMHTRTHTRNL